MTESGFDWRRLMAPVIDDGPGDRGATASAPPSPMARWLAVAGLVAAVAAVGIGLALGAPRTEVVIDGTAAASSDAVVAGGADASPAPVDGTIVVDVDGAVIHPGLVTLPADSRVGHALAAAGGFSPSADARAAAAINLAAPVRDGDQISVLDRATAGASLSIAPADGGAAGSGDTALEGDGGGAPIDLDRATAAELDTLPGIGPVTADKILAARDEAPFASVDDLLARKVVGPSTFEKIKGLVTADGR